MPGVTVPGMQTKRVLKPGHFYTAAAALYSILLVAWWPGDVGQLCREVYQSCSPLPDVSIVHHFCINLHALVRPAKAEVFET